MPYDVKRSGKGYKVVEKKGGKHPGKAFSKEPMSKEQAEKQREAIAIHSHKHEGK